MVATVATGIVGGTPSCAAGGQTPDRVRRHRGRRDAREAENPMPTIALMIGGMTCRHCVRDVTSRLRDVGGVDTVTADAGTSAVRLSGTMTVDDVLGALRDLSYPVQLLNEAAGTAETDESAETAETAES